jgi:hypothetical protein
MTKRSVQRTLCLEEATVKISITYNSSLCCDECCDLGCNAVQSDRIELIFQMLLLLPSSGWNVIYYLHNNGFKYFIREFSIPIPLIAGPSGRAARRSAAARLLRLWVRIPLGAQMSVCCECCVLSGRGLCDESIARPEEFYRLWCVVVCDLETSKMRMPWPTVGLSRQK